jgi:hypothetical protein
VRDERWHPVPRRQSELVVMAQARQFDLFGEQEAKEAARVAKERAAAEWRARFERAPVPPPPLYPGDVPAPGRETRVWLGWVCPACKVVEPNEFLLGNNHGYHLHWPGHVPYRAEFGATCSRLELLAAHALYDKRRAMIRHLIAAGMDDEQIAAQVGFWSASMTAGLRKDDAKAARLAARAARGEIVKVPHGSDCPCAFCDGPCTCPSCQAFRGIPVEVEGRPF